MLVVPFMITALALQAAPQGNKKPDPEQVSFRLHWVRQDAPVPGGTATTLAAAPVILAAPILTTLDGQTASIEVKTAPETKTEADGKKTKTVVVNPGSIFFVSLSPTVEPADNKKQQTDTASANGAPTVRIFWSLRVAGSLPGGVESLSLTGASRLATGTGADAVVARFSLADPKTGTVTEYRLEGNAVLGKDAAAEATAPVTPKP